MSKNKLDVSFLFLLMVCAAYLVGHRDLSVGSDTLTYANKFVAGSSCKCLGGHEIGFELFLYPMYMLGLSPQIIFVIISLVLYALMCLSSVKLVSMTLPSSVDHRVKLKYGLLVFAFMMMLPLTVQLHINAIRQGLSAMCFLLSFLCLRRKENRLSLLFLVLSVGFHYSIILILPFYALFFYTRMSGTTSFYISVFVFTLLSLVYLSGYAESIVKVFSDFSYIPVWRLVSEYGSGSGYKDGVRYDFYIFSVFLMLPIFWYALKNVEARAYLVFVMASMIPFLLLGWGAYSNRYVLNTWAYSFVGLIAYLVLAFPGIYRVYWVVLLAAFAINVYQGTGV